MGPQRGVRLQTRRRGLVEELEWGAVRQDPPQVPPHRHPARSRGGNGRSVLVGLRLLRNPGSRRGAGDAGADRRGAPVVREVPSHVRVRVVRGRGAPNLRGGANRVHDGSRGGPPNQRQPRRAAHVPPPRGAVHDLDAQRRARVGRPGRELRRVLGRGSAQRRAFPLRSRGGGGDELDGDGGGCEPCPREVHARRAGCLESTNHVLPLLLQGVVRAPPGRARRRGEEDAAERRRDHDQLLADLHRWSLLGARWTGGRDVDGGGRPHRPHQGSVWRLLCPHRHRRRLRWDRQREPRVGRRLKGALPHGRAAGAGLHGRRVRRDSWFERHPGARALRGRGCRTPGDGAPQLGQEALGP
mmetsp:Transcript_68073/g.136943  ORF Transcript_68073/g.136943 Transcript_68073/m.136943 type:complete len:356 (+) Transcript_68073:165-1232(+)